MRQPTSDVLRDEAYRRYQQGDTGTAEGLCRQILAQQPRHAEAIYLLGAIAHDSNQLQRACELFAQSVEIAPDNAVFVNALGEAYSLLGDHDKAMRCFERAIDLRPTYERAYNNRGRLQHSQGSLEAAKTSFAEAVRLNPRYATGHNNLGAALQALSQLEAAAAHFQQALNIKPDYPEANFNLGTALQAKGDPVAAAARFQEAIRLRPNYVRAHFHLGQVLELLRKDYAALACFQTAVRLQPNDSEMQRRLGDLLILKKDWPEALAALDHAAQLAPDKSEPFARLVYAKHQVCDWSNYEADIDRLWSDAEKDMAAGKASAVVPFQSMTLPWPLPRLLAVARSHCDAVVQHQRERGVELRLTHSRERTGRLRIGYLSGDFYDHPIGHLLHGLFGCHDRSQFEIFAYSIGPNDGSVYRQQIASECDHFAEVGDLSILSLAQRIAADGINILVDLMGHTGVNRLGALALRPAPIQVSFLGMLGTMGASFIDYVIGDRIVTPPSFAPEFTEKVVVMPDCYLIAEPVNEKAFAEPCKADFGLPASGFVFCSFNSSYKIEPHTFDVWMRILARTPGSVLWLYSNGATLEQNLKREAASRGVSSTRLVFAPFVPRPQHFHRHKAADLFLDTLQYNAAATASLALQAGLPVLSCLGTTFSSRVGASLLSAVGLPELLAKDVDQYEQIAVDLAANPDKLLELKDNLSASLPTSPLFDTPKFVRNLERAYLAMWNGHASGHSPQAIKIEEAGQRDFLTSTA